MTMTNDPDLDETVRTMRGEAMHLRRLNRQVIQADPNKDYGTMAARKFQRADVADNFRGRAEKLAIHPDGPTAARALLLVVRVVNDLFKVRRREPSAREVLHQLRMTRLAAERRTSGHRGGHCRRDPRQDGGRAPCRRRCRNGGLYGQERGAGMKALQQDPDATPILGRQPDAGEVDPVEPVHLVRLDHRRRAVHRRAASDADQPGCRPRHRAGFDREAAGEAGRALVQPQRAGPAIRDAMSDCWQGEGRPRSRDRAQRRPEAGPARRLEPSSVPVARHLPAGRGVSAHQRLVTLAPGHQLLVRRGREPAAKPGCVRVIHRSRGSIDIPERAWLEGSPA